MASPPTKSQRTDPFKTTLMIFAIIGFMYFTAEVLKPLALSILLSFALAPAARRAERWGVPRAPAVALTFLISLSLLGGIGYVVGQQLTSLARRLPDYQKNIETKLGRLLSPNSQSTASRLKVLADEVTAKVEKPTGSDSEDFVPIPKVEVVAHRSFQDQIRSTTGPYLEFLGVGSFVLILALFILMGREQLSDRIIGLFGHHHVSLTTRTMQEIGHRISRYLATFAMVNSGFGVVIGLGLALIGVPYAVLWGCLAAMLRFIPYVGPAAAFLLPLTFSFAFFSGWAAPLEVVALFAVVEVALTSFLEPVIYGKTTGVSALGLLVAAMFWTWLWGTLGLVLSTPLTVCLAVLGKYVPSIWFFAALLDEDTDLKPDVQLYQRLLGLDREGAVLVIETELKKRPRVEVFDQVLVPTLALAERDSARDELDDTKQEFIWSVIDQILDELEGTPDHCLASVAAPAGVDDPPIDPAAPIAEPIHLIGLPVQDTADVLILRMLAQLLPPSSCVLEIVKENESTLEVTEHITEQAPGVIVLSYLPPEGLTMTRYLVRRLHAQLASTPIVVGRWGQTDGGDPAAQKLVDVGAANVVSTLADARTTVLKMVASAAQKSLQATAGVPR